MSKYLQPGESEAIFEQAAEAITHLQEQGADHQAIQAIADAVSHPTWEAPPKPKGRTFYSDGKLLREWKHDNGNWYVTPCDDEE